MKKPTVREVAAEIGVSVGLAHGMLSSPWSPDPEKFRTSEKFYRRLCESAVRHGHRDESILRYLSEKAQARAPVREEKATEPEPEPAAPTYATVAPAGASPAAVDETEKAIADGLRISVATMRQLGAAQVRCLKEGDTAGAALISRDFVKVLAELRQTATKLEEIQRERGLLLRRDDVVRTFAECLQKFRATTDRLLDGLVSPGALPAWVAAAGGTFPEDRAAAEVLRSRLGDFIRQQVDDLCAAFEGVVNFESVSAAGRRECRIALAELLEAQAKRLREAAA